MSRNYTFTWNNYNADSEKYLRSLAGVKYCCGGYEVGESLTPHIQGYIMFKSVKSFTSVIKLLPGCHVETAKCVEEGIAYCKKDGTFFEFGVMPVTKKAKGVMEKERYQVAWELAKEGKIEEIDADIRWRLYGTAKKIAFDYAVAPDPLETLSNEWIWGPTGCGKSKSTRDCFPDAYIKDPKEKWWDGYRGQEVVIVDDFDKYNISFSGDMKRWCDHYPFPAQIKGGTIMIRPKKIIVTSNYSPEEIWQDAQTLEPINRRFNVIHMGPSTSAYAAIFTHP